MTITLHKIDTDAEINWVRLREQTDNPTLPASGYGNLYIKNNGRVYLENSSGLETKLSISGASEITVDPSSFTGNLSDTDTTVQNALATLDQLGVGIPVENNICDFRLTLETGVPISTTNQSAKTVIYWTPTGKGNRVDLYTSFWVKKNSDEISIKLTDAQTGNTTNGSKVITNLSDTTQFIVGMEVTGTGIAGSSVIASIDSSTQITLNNNATANGTGVTLTFKVPASTILDVFVYDNTTTLKLEFVAWTNDTDRAIALSMQDGVLVKSGNATRRYIGTVRTTTTAGQTEDSITRRFVVNFYNTSNRLLILNLSGQHTYTTTSQRLWNSSTSKAEFIVPVISEPVIVNATAAYSGNTANAVNSSYALMDGTQLGMGFDFTPTGLTAGWHNRKETTFASVGVGYHYIQGAEFGYGTSASCETFKCEILLPC